MKRGNIVMVIAIVLLIILIVVFAMIHNMNENDNVKIKDIKTGDIKTGDIKTGDIKTGDIKIGDIKIGDIKTKKEREVVQQYTLEDTEGLNELESKIPVGELTICKSDSDFLEISVLYHIITYRQEEIEMLEKNLDVETRREGNCLSVEVVRKEDGSDLWSWANDHLGDYNISANLTIRVPEKFVRFNVQTDTGAIHLVGLSGEFDVSSDIGRIDIKNCSFQETSSVRSNVGDIVVELLPDVMDKGILDLSVDVGNIDIDLNANEIDCQHKSEGLLEAYINDLYLNASIEVGKFRISK